VFFRKKVTCGRKIPIKKEVGSKKKLSSRVIKGTKKQARGKSVDKISNIRDEYLVSLLKMRKKFETKLR